VIYLPFLFELLEFHEELLVAEDVFEAVEKFYGGFVFLHNFLEMASTLGW
jgi:hypothetical protein